MRRLLSATALLCLLLALGPVAGAAADPVSGGTMRLPLHPALFASLRAAGVELRGRGAARIAGRQLSAPVTGGQLSAGSGRLLAGGAIQLSGAGGTVSLSHLVLDSKAGALIAELDGRRLRLALARRPRARRYGFGFQLTFGKLVLTAGGARRLDQGLGLGGLLGAGDVLGTATAGARLSQVTVTYGTAYLGFAQVFADKLKELDVAGEPLGGGWYYSKSPLTVALAGLQGVAALDLASGELESADGIRLFQGEVRGGEVQPTPGAPEIVLQGVSIDLAAGTVAADIRAQPSGAGEVTAFAALQIPVFHKNAFTGVLSIPNSPLTLSPYLAELLNRTFAEARGRPALFAAGEPLGQVAFMAGTKGQPR